MTDEEWVLFRARYLNLNNIYIPDEKRSLYDASVVPRDSPGAIKSGATIEEPPPPPPPQAKAPMVEREPITKPQPVFGLSEFLSGGQK